jgi:hypothetical protein
MKKQMPNLVTLIAVRAGFLGWLGAVTVDMVPCSY